MPTFLRWSPTIIYAALAIATCVIHNTNMAPVVDKLASIETTFSKTHAGLKAGEELSSDAQTEMVRVATHHVHHAGDFVGWTRSAIWWLTMPGIAVAVIQGVICSKWPERRGVVTTTGNRS